MRGKAFGEGVLEAEVEGEVDSQDTGKILEEVMGEIEMTEEEAEIIESTESIAEENIAGKNTEELREQVSEEDTKFNKTNKIAKRAVIEYYIN